MDMGVATTVPTVTAAMAGSRMYGDPVRSPFRPAAHIPRCTRGFPTPLFLLLAFSALAFGGVEFWALRVLEGGVLLLTVAVLCRPSGQDSLAIRGSPLLVLWMVLGVLGAAQLLSNRAASTDRQATVDMLVLYGAGGLYFLLMLHSLQTPEALRRFLWGLLILGFSLAFLGLAQQFSGTEKIYWVRHLSLTRAPHFFGPFVNRDHFASAMGMLLPLGWATWTQEQGAKKAFGAVLWIFMGWALWMCGSRAGSLTAAAGVGWMFLWKSQPVRYGAFFKISVSLIILAGVLALTWVWINKDVLPFETIQSVGSVRWRLQIWQAAYRMIGNCPLFGVGLGAFATQFPVHQIAAFPFSVTHAHNEYLEWLSEAGFIGFGGILAPVLFWFWRMQQFLSRRQDVFLHSLGAAGLASMAAMASHGFVEFSLRIPFILFLFLTVIALTQNALEMPGVHPGSLSRRTWIPLVRGSQVGQWAIRLGGTCAALVGLVFLVLQPGLAAYFEVKTHTLPLEQRQIYLEKAISLQRSNPLYHQVLAGHYVLLAQHHPLEAGEWLHKAADQYREAIRVNSYLAASWQGLAWTYGNLGNIAAAISAFRRAIACAPKDPFIYRSFAQWGFYRLLNNPSDAARYLLGELADGSFKEAYRLNPSEGRDLLAQCARRGNGRKLLSLWVANDPSLMGAWAYVLKDQGSKQEAKAAFREAVKLSEQRLRQTPDDAFLHFQLGDYLFYGLDERERGIQAVQRALGLSPRNVSFHKYYGQMLYWGHDYAGAQAEFSTWHVLDPRDDEVWTWSRRVQQARETE